jgi:hypothetical protein
MHLTWERSAPGRRTLPSMVLLLICLPLCCLRGRADAQQTATSTGVDQSKPVQTGSITGTVSDADGAVLADAQVSLSTAASTAKTLSGVDGSFSFVAIAPGPFTISASIEGFASKSASGVLHPGESYEVPLMELAAATNVDVEVTLSPHELAQAEMKLEEHQRLAGFLPNFFVTYDWHAAPLSSKQKYELAWRTTIDPATLIVNGAVAGVEQAQNNFSGYGLGAQGYGKRYGAAAADTAIGNFLGGAIFPSLLHQDPRYFYMGKGSFQKRLSYALAAAVICRGDNGKWQPNYSSILGDFAAGGISNLYYPAASRNGAGLTIENGVLGVVGDAVGNVIQEFLFKKITPHVPKSSSSTP